MEHSTYYQMIKKLGRDEGYDAGRNDERILANRDSILLLGTDRFGEAAEALRIEIERIDDAERLTRMLRQVPRSASWDEVLKVG